MVRKTNCHWGVRYKQTEGTRTVNPFGRLQPRRQDMIIMGATLSLDHMITELSNVTLPLICQVSHLLL